MWESSSDNPAVPEAPVPWESIETTREHQPDAHVVAQSSKEEILPPVRGGGWTISLLCGGLALVACGVLIPQADANRRLAYERAMLSVDLETIERQVSVNAEFIKKVGEDPTLAQRLAERQMKVIPQGARVLELKHDPDGSTMSPFQLVSVPPPPPPPPYKPLGGTIANLCYNPHTRLYLMGTALVMMAVGLVLGYSPQK